MNQYSITNVPSSTTKILPCRNGDVFLWITDKAPSFGLTADLGVSDVWIARHSDTVVFTNMLEEGAGMASNASNDGRGHKCPPNGQKAQRGL